jgi:hypothetical protein
VLYGRAVTPRLFTLTALWDGALRAQPIRIVVVRDPSGRRREEAFFCTDLTQAPAFILQTYAARWTLEVTFHDSKQHLGFGQAQNQTPRAVARTAPFAGLVYSLVLLWRPRTSSRVAPSTGSCARGTAPRWPWPSPICSRRSATNSGAPAFLRHRSSRGASKIRLQFPTTLSDPPHNGASRDLDF